MIGQWNYQVFVAGFLTPVSCSCNTSSVGGTQTQKAELWELKSKTEMEKKSNKNTNSKRFRELKLTTSLN